MLLSPEQIAYTIESTAAPGRCSSTPGSCPSSTASASACPSSRVRHAAPDRPAARPPLARWAGDEALLAAADPQHAFSGFRREHRATTFYTTRHHGPAGGVFFSHRQLVLHAPSAPLAGWPARCQSQRFHRGDVCMPIAPMFPRPRLGPLPYVATMLGVKRKSGPLRARHAAAAAPRTEGVTFSHCVPTILQMLLLAPAARRWTCPAGRW